MNFFKIKMISRKERQVQKALGTEDSMPPTIYRRAQYLWWGIVDKTYKWRGGAFWQWLAFKLPKKLVYHCTIRTWAHATTCPSGRKENVYETTMENALVRWEKE